jgi:hypothetical protein
MGEGALYQYTGDVVSSLWANVSYETSYMGKNIFNNMKTNPTTHLSVI